MLKESEIPGTGRGAVPECRSVYGALLLRSANRRQLFGHMLQKTENKLCETDSFGEDIRIRPRVQALIDEILQYDHRGGWQHLFLQAKALELLALQCRQLESTMAKPSALRPADINKIQQAREILLKDIQHPPSLNALARMAGLNEYKLKAGFKQVFGNTVFGYLKDHRLTLARRLILEGEKNITEVAYETGYSTVQHFSSEFKKKFGTNPAKLGLKFSQTL